MESYEIVYKLDSDANFSGSIEVYELANAMMAFANAVQGALDECPEKGTLKVDVKPFKQGSFITEFVLSYGQSAIDLFSSNSVNALANALGILGFAFGSAVTLPKVVRKTKGIISDFKRKDDGIYIYGSGDEQIEVDELTHKIIQSPKVAKAYKTVVSSPISNIDKSLNITIQEKSEFEKGLSDSGEFFTSGDLPSFERYEQVAVDGVPEETEEIVSRIKNAILKPVLGPYSGAERGYTFKCGEDTFRGVQMLDNDFREKLDTGVVRLMGNDVLIADIEDIQNLSKTGKVSHHRSILKVNKYQKYNPPRQTSLEDFN